jgi:hypothetical protein
MLDLAWKVLHIFNIFIVLFRQRRTVRGPLRRFTAFRSSLCTFSLCLLYFDDKALGRDRIYNYVDEIWNRRLLVSVADAL